jgi:GNAT superfamily N-acetyltransferase
MVEPAAPGDAPVLAELYEQVLWPAFPPDELDEPWSSYGSAELSEALPVVVAFDAYGRVVGGAVGEWYDHSRVVLLAYIATREGARGQGIGGRMLAMAVEEWRAVTDANLVLTEIEDPRFHLPSYGGDPTERVAFYERHGTRALDAPYFQPRLRPEGRRVYHLLLSVIWAADQALMAGGRGLVASPVRAFLNEYFSASEGVEPDDADEELRSLLEAYGAETIPMRPIAEHANLGRFHVAGCGHL